MKPRSRSWIPRKPASQISLLKINNGSQIRAKEISASKNHPVNASDLKPGDHYFFWITSMNIRLYSHHGIYVGKGLFIHLTASEKREEPPLSCKLPGCGEHCPKSAVFQSCVECFCGGKPLYRYEYGVGVDKFFHLRSAYTTATSGLCEEVISRARWLLLQGVGNYNLLRLNCEDFAMFCKSGLICVTGASGQVNTYISALVTLIAMKFIGPVPYPFLAKLLVIYQASRSVLDLGVRFDTIKVKTKSSNITLSSLERGDLIYLSTEMAGFYMGKGAVISFALSERNRYRGGGKKETGTTGMKLRCGTAKLTGMTLVCIDCFTKTRALYRYEYKVPYETVPQSGSPEVVADRAADLFFGPASCPSFNDIIDFVYYCKLGFCPDERWTSGNDVMVKL